MKKYFIIAIIIIVIAGVVFVLTKDKEEIIKQVINYNTNQIVKINNNQENINPTDNQNSGCSNEEVVFTNNFVDNDKIASIGPIGALDGGSHGRSYIRVKEGVQTPVYAPTDVTLEYIIYARRGSSLDYGEYGLWFRAGCDLVFLLDHLDSLSEEIQALAPTEFSESSAVNGPIIGYQAKAGELIAYSDGTDMARTFDFLVLDRSKPVEYINPDRFEWDQNLYSQCPYDYYTGNLKDEYYSLLEPPNGINMDCGSPSFDLAGTASGAWFQGDDKDMSGGWLTFGTYTNFSGLAIRDDGARDFSVRDYDPVIKPEDMTFGDQVCYDYNNNWAYARLKNSDELEVATGQGNCPSSFSELQAEIWVR